jgi:hypothetical protein
MIPIIPDQDKKRKQKKTVRFAADIKLYPGRRSNRFFRKHLDYVPGRHSAPRDSQWEDTPFCTSHPHTRQQSKFFFITQQAAERVDLDRPEQWPELEGLAVFNRKAARIEEPMERALREMVPEYRTEFLYDCDYC